MNPVLQDILDSGVAESESGEFLQVHSAISLEEGRFLQEILLQCKPLLSLEVGLAFGVSALFICEALSSTPGAQHIILDPYQFSDRWRGSGLQSLRKAGYAKIIEFHNQFSHLALAELELRGTKVDFVFVDGHHCFDYVLVDFFHIDRILRPGGIIVFDDTHAERWPSIRKACRFVLTNRSYSVFRCFPASRHSAQRSWKARILRNLSVWSPRLRAALSPEFLESDAELGVPPAATCIALKKEAGDERHFRFHRTF